MNDFRKFNLSISRVLVLFILWLYPSPGGVDGGHLVGGLK